MISTALTGWRVRIARAVWDPPLPQLTPLLPPPPLALQPPEVLKQNAYDETVDIYSLGVVLYELFMRRSLVIYFNSQDNFVKMTASDYAKQVCFPFLLHSILFCCLGGCVFLGGEKKGQESACVAGAVTNDYRATISEQQPAGPLLPRHPLAPSQLI